MMSESVTKAGHDPAAVAMLTTVLAPHVADPFDVAAEVFIALHDAGVRIVAADRGCAAGQRIDP